MKKGQPLDDDTKDIPVIEPDSREGIRHSTGALYSYMPRKLPIHAVIHDSVFERMKNALPVYQPQSLFNVNEELLNKRRDIEAEGKKLVETRTLQDEEYKSILAWSQENLTLTKWSRFLISQLDETSTMKDRLRPADQLSNPPMLLIENGKRPNGDRHHLKR